MNRRTIAELGVDDAVAPAAATDLESDANTVDGERSCLTSRAGIYRLLPAIQEHVVFARLRGRVRQISELISVGDAVGARRALALTCHQLAQRPQSAEQAAELNAIRLILDRAGELLNGTELES